MMIALEPQPEIDTDRLILRPRAGAGVAFDIDHRQFGHIGRVGFQEDQPRRPELDVWLEPPFRGRGYGPEAVRAALRWAGADWRRAAVWTGHCADDRAAGQALSKAGFLYTGDVVRTGAVATRMMVWLA